jgi:hypothetical protein
MPLSRGLRRLLTATALLAAVLVGPAPVLADCVAPPPIEKAVAGAEIVFVGTVTAVESAGRTASVNVEEVWRGDVPAEVVLNDDLDPDVISSVDRTFDVGVRYLFLPSAEDGRLIDTQCSSTVAWDDGLAAFRPAEAHQPVPGTDDRGPLGILGELGGPVLVVSIVGGLLLATVLVARRRDD